MLYFHNRGEIDIRGATVAGLSAKDGDSPIGFFGTGLKYSIACILRWGGEITIHSGLTPHTFTAEAVQFRGKSFAQVFHNGTPCGFTTEYGKNWEPWQVFRELYANAVDEVGVVDTVTTLPTVGVTIIAVRCERLEAIYSQRDKIILPALTYDYVDKVVSVKAVPAPSIYYRGVRVYDVDCALTYNFTSSMDLTEDRTVKYTFQIEGKVAKALQQLTDEAMILSALTAKNGCIEASLNEFAGYYETSPEFIAVARRLFKQDAKKWAKLHNVIKEYASDLLAPKLVALSPMRQKMLERAISLCERMGYANEFPVQVADLGNSTLGEWDQAAGIIYLSPTVFDQGTKQVVSTLYEELTHAHTGKVDCNYDMQTHLFNTIISLYEEHVFCEPM